MNTYLFTWNPKSWEWDDLEDSVNEVNVHGVHTRPWSCGNTRRIEPGDRAFLIKIGPEAPKGIVGEGTIVTVPYADVHFSDPLKIAHYVVIDFEVLINPYKDPILTLDVLQQGRLGEQKWTPESSGISIRSELVDELELLWFDFLQTQPFRHNPLVSEADADNETLWEGETNQVFLTRYERNKEARSQCISHWGTSCSVCGIDFEKVYGKRGSGFIHVHHLNPIANAVGPYKIDPVEDLRPVCPNCHAMLHRGKDLLSIEALRNILSTKHRYDVM